METMSFVSSSHILPLRVLIVSEKLLAQLKGADREGLIEDMKPQLLQLKKYNYGKQIAAIEKLIFTGPPPSFQTQIHSAPSTQTMPIEINSSAATPMLTSGQNSPLSSSLPSTNVSTIEESTDVSGKPVEASSETLPEVVINGH